MPEHDRQCRKCGHRQSDHPNSFLCGVDDCRCPGYFAIRHPDREDV